MLQCSGGGGGGQILLLLRLLLSLYGDGYVRVRALSYRAVPCRASLMRFDLTTIAIVHPNIITAAAAAAAAVTCVKG